MSVLDRYKKPGGFIQLLTLLETCGVTKKEKFLQMISDENLEWFNALKSRILTMEIILNWPQEFLIELTSRTQPITLAAIAKGPLNSDQIHKLQHGLSHSQLSKMREISENKSFTSAEVNSSIEKFLGEVRVHIQHGVIKLEKFAPELAVSTEIEEMLLKKSTPLNFGKFSEESETHEYHSPQSPQISSPETNSSTNHGINMTSSSSVQIVHDDAQLKKQNQQLQNELQVLRQENRLLKEKLDKIRKIA